jgi:hypothetical protein
MTARELEANALARCVEAARSTSATVHSAQEANVFRVAAMVLASRWPVQAARWRQLSDAYFAQHPADKLAVEQVVRNGWVLSLPRLRDMLSRQLGSACEN